MSFITEKSIVTLIKVFYKYAGKGGDPLSLETHELRQLLRKEMPTLHPVSMRRGGGL
uniref:S100/CaBP-9k-type calcium binding subdomain domain-containing protein n=1 Tax=Leptobrachium leishanense TaxID=445787 RepID=A0A8C5PTA9_9ANUR